MKKYKIPSIMLIMTFVIALTVCGTVFAYMFKQTDYEDNQFTPAVVSCRVEETFDGTKKTSIKVENTGNIDAYLRVRLVSYWVDTNGNVVAKPSSIPEINLEDGWIKGPNNTYYYQSSVAPNNLTGELLSSSISLEKDANGYLQVVEVFAEAIQSNPKDAVTSSWDVLLDQNGYIVSP